MSTLPGLDTKRKPSHPKGYYVTSNAPPGDTTGERDDTTATPSQSPPTLEDIDTLEAQIAEVEELLALDPTIPAPVREHLTYVTQATRILIERARRWVSE